VFDVITNENFEPKASKNFRGDYKGRRKRGPTSSRDGKRNKRVKLNPSKSEKEAKNKQQPPAKEIKPDKLADSMTPKRKHRKVG
jgi:hypothetical protein